MVTEKAADRQVQSSPVCGGLDGPNSMYVKLISSDGHEFIILREHAVMSGTIRAILSGSGQFAGNETNVIRFTDIPSHILEKVCVFFKFKEHCIKNSINSPDFPIPPHIAVDLLNAASFLDC